jgi:hypothetical protein
MYLRNPGGGLCTGSLIAPNVVLTAAHCQITAGATAMTMNGDQPVSEHSVVRVVYHRRHDGGDSFSHHDASLALLGSEPDVEPLPFRVDPLPDVVGEELTVVGFGVTDGETMEGGGRKRIATFDIELMIPDYLRGSAPGTSICYGDSGGPAFMSFDGVETVVGITRSHFASCTGDSQWTRVDTYAPDFIVPFVDAWYGPCRMDGDCVEVGCRTPDPDCAPCGVDYVCSPGCPEVDLDCPLGLDFGFECTGNDDCESRLCIEDTTEPGSLFCSQTCEPEGVPCPSEAECLERDGTWLCAYADEPEEPEDSGGCTVSGRTSALASWGLLLLVVALLLARRRWRSLPLAEL